MKKAKIYLCVCLCTLAGLAFSAKGGNAKEEECGPTQEELTPPPTPEGYVYIGCGVVINFHYSKSHSTAPPDYTTSPEDIVVVRGHTVVKDGVTVCEVIVTHIFVPKEETEDCGPTQEELTPPPAPECHVYVGYDVVVNSQVTESTIPLDYVESPEHINIIRGHTIVEDGVTVCDVIVRHLFAPKEETDDCGPTPEELTPPPTPEGYVYIGYDVVVNFQLTESTIPLDRPESPEDISVIRGHTIVEDGVTVCDVIVRHLFAPKEKKDECGPTQEELAPPPTPEGYVYVGYNVVVNSVLTDYTVPLDRPDSPEDIVFVRSHTIVEDGVTVCDVIVTHVFAPEPKEDEEEEEEEEEEEPPIIL